MNVDELPEAHTVPGHFRAPCWHSPHCDGQTIYPPQPVTALISCSGWERHKGIARPAGKKEK